MIFSENRVPLFGIMRWRREVALAELGRQWRGNCCKKPQARNRHGGAALPFHKTSGGPRGGIAMRKIQLLTTVAAGLLLVTAAGAADNNDQKSKSEMSNPAPAAQRAAPAEKVAPSMHAGERKAPETTGQATKSDNTAKPDMKSDDSGKAGMKAEETKPQTSGQAPKTSDTKASDSKADTKSEMKSMDKSGAAKSDASKSDTSKTGATATDKSGAAQKATESTTGQGAAAGSAKLSTEQRTKITTAIKKQSVKPVQLNISVRVGASVPSSVHFYPLPTEVVEVYPEWRGYDFILVGNEIIILNPGSHTIVAILEA
jgi:hypothetical protein